MKIGRSRCTTRSCCLCLCLLLHCCRDHVQATCQAGQNVKAYREYCMGHTDTTDRDPCGENWQIEAIGCDWCQAGKYQPWSSHVSAFVPGVQRENIQVSAALLLARRVSPGRFHRPAAPRAPRALRIPTPTRAAPKHPRTGEQPATQKNGGAHAHWATCAQALAHWETVRAYRALLCVLAASKGA